MCAKTFISPGRQLFIPGATKKEKYYVEALKMQQTAVRHQSTCQQCGEALM